MQTSFLFTLYSDCGRFSFLFFFSSAPSPRGSGVLVLLEVQWRAGRPAGGNLKLRYCRCGGGGRGLFLNFILMKRRRVAGTTKRMLPGTQSADAVDHPESRFPPSEVKRPRVCIGPFSSWGESRVATNAAGEGKSLAPSWAVDYCNLLGFSMASRLRPGHSGTRTRSKYPHGNHPPQATPTSSLTVRSCNLHVEVQVGRLYLFFALLLSKMTFCPPRNLRFACILL